MNVLGDVVVLMAYPLEQGLKPGRVRRGLGDKVRLNGLSTRTRIETSRGVDVDSVQPSLNGLSTRTRIETDDLLELSIVHSVVLMAYPLEQGLKLETMAGGYSRSLCLNGLSTRTRIETRNHRPSLSCRCWS